MGLDKFSTMELAKLSSIELAAFVALAPDSEEYAEEKRIAVEELERRQKPKPTLKEIIAAVTQDQKEVLNPPNMLNPQSPGRRPGQ
jgi:hypothetical protein